MSDPVTLIYVVFIFFLAYTLYNLCMGTAQWVINTAGMDTIEIVWRSGDTCRISAKYPTECAIFPAKRTNMIDNKTQRIVLCEQSILINVESRLLLVIISMNSLGVPSRQYQISEEFFLSLKSSLHFLLFPILLKNCYFSFSSFLQSHQHQWEVELIGFCSWTEKILLNM